MKSEEIRYNTLREDVRAVVENPFVDDNYKDALKASYVLFRYCLTNVRCGDKCPMRSIIGCEGKETRVNAPRQWGYNIKIVEEGK